MAWLATILRDRKLSIDRVYSSLECCLLTDINKSNRLQCWTFENPYRKSDCEDTCLNKKASATPLFFFTQGFVVCSQGE